MVKLRASVRGQKLTKGHWQLVGKTFNFCLQVGDIIFTFMLEMSASFRRGRL